MPDNKPSISWIAADGAYMPVPTGGTYSGSESHEEVLYLFLDESGNFDFSTSGTEYFYMTCVVATRPFGLEMPLTSLRYDFIEDNNPIEAFHACEDNKYVREQVFKRIEQGAIQFSAYSIRVNKTILPKDMKDAGELYYKAFEWITDEVYAKEVTNDTKQVIVITDDLPKLAKKKQVERPLKEFMKRRFQQNGIPYLLLHHKSCSSVYLQIADYLSWAVQRKYTRGYSWPMEMITNCFKEIGTTDVA